MDPKKDENPLEIPENNPERKSPPEKTIGKGKTREKKSRVKIAYAFAVMLIFGGALVSKIITEKSLGNLNVPIESDYITTKATLPETEDFDYEVRNNLTNVPDTRETTPQTEQTTQKATEATTKSPYQIPFKDNYLYPIGSTVTKKFEASKPIYYKALGEWRTHPAIDLKGDEGAPVFSMAYGTVKKIFDDAAFGTVVEIDHGNGLIAEYCGFDKDAIDVNVGQTLKAEETIGFLGDVPCEKDEGSHLHLEIRYNGQLVDGQELIN